MSTVSKRVFVMALADEDAPEVVIPRLDLDVCGD
jgi:hypothetical protein